MKVKELILLLQQENPEDEVLLSQDMEGNNFRTINNGCIGNAIFEKDEETENCEIWDTNWTADEAEEYEENWNEMLKEMPRCIVIYPS